MAAIREELILVDRFSQTFSQYLRMGQQAAKSTELAGRANADYNAKMAELGTAAARAGEALTDLGNKLREAGDGSNAAADKQEKANRAMRSGAKAADGLASKLKSLAAAYVSLRGVQKLVDLSDTWTQTTARLDRMNDGRQSTPEVQDMIYQSAQRSRGDYQDTADMVAKLGTMAPEAFSSTAEVVAFAEQINKQFALAGTSTQGAQAAMLQLTQAMSSGVLRGEELNSVLEQAPTITQTIAKYLGKSVGELREMASEGKITAQVVKAALFDAAEETNAAFEAVPLTFSQAWTMAKNAALNAFRPALEELNSLLNSEAGQDVFNGLLYAAQLAGQAVTWLIQLVGQGAQWVRDNWDTVSTVLIGLAVGVAAVMAASALQSAAAWMIANWPLVLIIGTITAVIFKAREMGVEWEEIFSKMGSVAGWLYALVYNLVADLWNFFAIFADFLGNVFDHPLASIARLFIDTFSAILGIIETVAGALDALTGWNVSGLVSGWRSGLNEWADKVLPKEHKTAQMEKLDYRDVMAQWSASGANIGQALDNFNPGDLVGSMGGKPFDYEKLLANSDALAGIKEDTAAIKRSVALSEEDMKLLVDMAERQYINNINLTTQTPVITINGQNTGNTAQDEQWFADTLKKMLIEQAASHTDLSYQ